MKPYLLLCLALFSLVPLRAERERRPETGRIVLYSGENFEGVSVELLPGAAVPNLGDLSFSDGRSVNDRISSVRIFGPLKVTLYADDDFRGASIELSESVARLNRVPRRSGGNWDNCVSSVRVSGGHPGQEPERDRGGDRRDNDGWNSGRGQDSGRNSNREQGNRWNANREQDDDRNVDRGQGNGWSSERNRGGNSDRGYEPERPRFHPEMPGNEVERLVSRAFRDLLSREPTGVELRRYREAVYNEGWEREQIYDDIRGSREFRMKEADQIIERVYRDLLGRNPDPSGREHWRRKIVDHGWTEERFRDEIRQSDEFRNRKYEEPKRDESKRDGRH